MTGSQLDADALTRDMTQAMENGGGSVELSVLAIQPDVTQSDIASQYGLIASAVTNASSSSSNRLSNIRLALQMINGTCLKPGETFSFNETVGKRTTDRGFKMATAYSSGTVVEDVGGGICQVSTTLFNAAVKADLQIVEHCHRERGHGHHVLRDGLSAESRADDRRVAGDAEGQGRLLRRGLQGAQGRVGQHNQPRGAVPQLLQDGQPDRRVRPVRNDLQLGARCAILGKGTTGGEPTWRKS